jgi:electron transport complex protein RnfE
MKSQPLTPAAYVLALCPVLAVSDNIVNALGIGVAAIVAITISSLVVTLIARRLPEEIRVVSSALILAAIVGCLMLLFNAGAHELHRSLSLYLPLLIANYVLLERIEESAARPPLQAVGRALRTGFTLAVALLALGIARELVGRGSLFYNAGAMLGDAAKQAEVQFFRADMGFLLATFPPGAFISVGLLLAARNWWLTRRNNANA